MKKIRFLLYTILSISLLILMVSMIRNSRHQGKEMEQEGMPLSRADMRLGAIHLTETNGEDKEWELTAEDVQYFKGKRFMLLKGIKILFFTESSGPVTLEGKEGIFDTDSGDIEVSGDVVVTSSEGHNLYTDFLKYRSDGKMITTESKVFLRGPDITVRGRGLSVDIKNDRFAILNNVHTEINGEL